MKSGGKAAPSRPKERNPNARDAGKTFRVRGHRVSQGGPERGRIGFDRFRHGDYTGRRRFWPRGKEQPFDDST
jgi:hypothetical protein